MKETVYILTLFITLIGYCQDFKYFDYGNKLDWNLEEKKSDT